MASTRAAAKQTDDPAQKEKVDFDLFTRLGGIQLFDSFSMDIIAESYTQDLPHVDLVPRPVLAHMTLTNLRDVGFRVQKRWTRHVQRADILRNAQGAPQFGESAKDSAIGQFLQDKETILTAGVRFLQRSDSAQDTLDFSGASAELTLQRSIAYLHTNNKCKAQKLSDLKKKTDAATDAATDAVKSTADKVPNASGTDPLKLIQKDVEDAKIAADNADDDLAQSKLAQAQDKIDKIESGPTPQKDIVDAAKQAADDATIGCQVGGVSVTLFGGLSGTMMHTLTIHDDTQNIEDPLFKEIRLTLGGDLQTSFAGNGTTLLPRLGAYAVLSRGTWQNRFAMGDAKHDVDAFQFEGAVYVSGHLTGGFDALVSFVALKPYGQGPVQFLINFAPAAGAVLGSQ